LLSANQMLLESIQHSDRILSVNGLSSLQVAAGAPGGTEDQRSESRIAIA
jgi:hypothetical protein